MMLLPHIFVLCMKNGELGDPIMLQCDFSRIIGTFSGLLFLWCGGMVASWGPRARNFG